jgi:hypothetical protein
MKQNKTTQVKKLVIKSLSRLPPSRVVSSIALPD